MNEATTAQTTSCPPMSADKAEMTGTQEVHVDKSTTPFPISWSVSEELSGFACRLPVG